ILPLLRGDRSGWPEEVFVQISESQVGRAVRTRRWKYGVTDRDRNGAQHSGSLNYSEDYLYDLEADSYELVNLIGYESHREVANVMKGRLLRWMVEAGEPQPEIASAPPANNKKRRVSQAETME
ncbi:MAG: acetylglucosamine-6-sulfatase, partial [Paenibacillaceae bacterium]|nr:acetylglucosamine-6-sulfatase [Paenibacillaceae bacterium]